MQVSELMTGSVDTCGPETTMDLVARQMAQDDVGSLAITRDGELLGIVTERDLVRAVADGRNPRTTHVEEIMTPNPDSLEPDVSVSDAANWMLAAGYRHLPVLEGERIVGIISMKDLMWALTERGATESLPEGSAQRSAGGLSEAYRIE